MDHTGDEQAQAAFERYVARLRPGDLQVPAQLQEGSSAPPSWTGTPEEWEAVRRRAVAALREKPAYDFGYAVAVEGYYPDELATGQLRQGAEVLRSSGKVVRRHPAHDEPTMRRARELVHEMAQAQVQLEVTLMLDLERVASGRPVGHARRVKVVIEAAESALSQHYAQKQSAAREEAARPVLTVHRRFRGIGGKNYAPGTYPVDPSVAAELRDWRERMEAQAKQHNWDAPSGFSPDSWPPFSIRSANIDD